MDVAVIGGGIVGVSAAAFLAEAGAEVTLAEREAIGAGASGRNSGAVQHPFDPALAALHDETVALYRDLDSPDTDLFPLDRPPDGLLSVAADPAPLEVFAEDVRRALPDLDPHLLDPAELAQVEPALAPGLYGCRTETAWAVPPAAAVAALAERARRAGARFVGWPEAFEIDAPVTLVTAGPWTSAAVDPTGAWQPIEPVWGVVAEVELEQPPRHVLEEAGIPELADALGAGEAPDELFSLVSAEDRHGLGSSFSNSEPDADAVARSLVARGRRFLAGVGAVRATRACARPVSRDGRPLVGRVGERTWVCAGHGPWGISIGPASARLVADLILGREPAPPPELDAARFGLPST
ncbi:MAG TPA: FAD-binding oxidoreductase [Thermoleophilaceae bacterium]|nr:FAD-binding oxidoreductase [Thermoleophilaceae bacterium]